jgi:hypothetical protein
MAKRQKQNPQTSSFSTETNQILRAPQADNRIYKRRLVFQNLIGSDGIGRIQAIYGMSPSGASDWASVSALYDEFRVVGCRLTLVSRQQNSVTAGSNAVYVVYDNDDGAVLTSYGEASEYQNCHVIPAIWADAKVYQFNFARPGAGSQTSLPWIDIAAPASSIGAIKLYAESLSNSTQYFHALLEWAVEFRGVR